MLDSFYQTHAPDTLEGGLYNEVNRLAQIWGPRLYPSGDFAVAAQAQKAYIDNCSANATAYSAHWKSLGPNDIVSGLGVGVIHKIIFPYNYDYPTGSHHTFYATSHHAGLWRTENNGASWNSVNTDLGIPLTSVADLAISHQNTDHLFICTGMSEGRTNFYTGLVMSNIGTSLPVYSFGVFRSLDYGATWQNMSGNLFDANNPDRLPDLSYTRKLLINPTNENIVFVATSQGIYKTEDGGVTWERKLNTTISNIDNELCSIEFKPNDATVLYASGRYIYRSTDGGDTWNNISLGINVGDLDLTNIIDVNLHPAWGYTGNEDNEGADRTNICVSAQNPDRLYAYFSYGSGKPAYIYAYDSSVIGINGEHWFNLLSLYPNIPGTQAGATPISDNYEYNSARLPLVASPILANRLYFGSVNNSALEISVTSNKLAGTLLAATTAHTDVHALVFAPNASSLPLPLESEAPIWMGDDGGVWLSNNACANWLARSKGLGISLIWSFDDSEFDNDRIGLAVQDDYTIAQSENTINNPNPWKFVNGGDGYAAQIDDYNGQDLYSTENNSKGIHRANLSSTNATFEDNTSGVPDPNPAGGTLLLPTGQNGVTPPTTFQVKNDPQDMDKLYFGLFELYQTSSGANLDDATSWTLKSDLVKHLGFDNLPLLNNSRYQIVNDNINEYRAIQELAIAESNPAQIYFSNFHFFSPQNWNPNLYNFHLFSSNLSGTDCIDPTQTWSFEDIGCYLVDAVALSQSVPGFMGELCVITGIAVDPDDEKKLWLSFSGYLDGLKVWYSENRGLTWQSADPNNTLCNMPVNNIVYQRGSDDRLYIATDVGVYYKDNSMTGWQRYGDIPNVRVTELKINDCSGNLRAATFGRGLWEVAPIPVEDLGEVAYEISNNTVWDQDDISMKRDIRIKAGYSLTVKKKLSMPKQGKIIVERGAKLMVDGGTITNFCEEMWQGIIVEGDPMEHQFADVNGNYAQGYLECKNGATIEYAHDAVMLWNPYIYNEHGGIVKATDSHFLNNRRSVSFMAYQNTSPGTINPAANASYFKNCQFEINNDYRRSDFWAHITAWKVDGIPIQGCDFKYTRTQGITDKAQMGKGIFTIDANFLVTDYCNSNTVPCPANAVKRSTFQGLNYGIHATAESWGFAFAVNRTDFNGNIRGVVSEKLEYFSATENEFTLGNNLNVLINPSLTVDYAGILGNRTYGYRIEENAFQGNANSATPYKWGATLIHSGAGNNQVYRNSYQNLTVGNFGLGFNRNKPGSSGLQFLCGNHSDDIYDMYIENLGADITFQGIRNEQSIVKIVSGIPTDYSAGNDFSLNGNNGESDYFNHTKNEIRYFRHAASGTPISHTPYTPQLYGGVTYTSVLYLQDCPSYINEGFEGELTEGQKNSTKTEYYNAEDAYANLLYTYNELIDEGNTSQLVMNIQVNWSDDAWGLRTQLLSHAPYLSEQAMIEALELAILPNAMIMEVLLANPDILRSRSFMEYLGNMSSPLPNYMMSVLDAMRNTGTSRTVLEEALATERYLMDFAGDRLLRDMCIYPNESKDSLLLWLDKMPSLQSKYTLAEHYAANHEYESALQILDDLSTQEGFDEAEHERYMDIFMLRKAVYQSNRILSQLSEEEKSALCDIREASDMSSSVIANNILCFWYNDCQEIEVPIPESEQQLRKIPTMPTATVLNNIYNSVVVYPNPSHGFTTFSYQIEREEKATLEIHDITGKIIETFLIKEKRGDILWDSRKYGNAIYIYEMKIGAEKVAVGKIVVEN